MPTKKPITVAVVSDLHAGSQLAPCPPEGVRLDDGGNYQPSRLQRWAWECWEDYWRFVKAVRAEQGGPLYVVLNGDAVEGDHHGTSQIISRNPEAQAYVLSRMLDVPKALGVEKWFVVRGTESHVGGAGAAEESLARGLGAVQEPDTHTHSRWHLRMALYGVRLDFQHHGRAGGVPWTRAAGIGRLAYRVWAEHAERGVPAPHLAVRSHLHVHADSYDIYKTRAIITPAWQAKTAYGHKVAADSIADIGGLALVVRPDATYDVRKKLYEPTLPKAWEVQ